MNKNLDVWASRSSLCGVCACTRLSVSVCVCVSLCVRVCVWPCREVVLWKSGSRDEGGID